MSASDGKPFPLYSILIILAFSILLEAKTLIIEKTKKSEEERKMDRIGAVAG